MIFCSDPQMETCCSREDAIIFPRQYDHEMFLLLDSTIAPEETSCKPTTLPPSGTPLSIFEFAALSSEQQKQWLDASGDMKHSTARRKARTNVVLPLSHNDTSSEQSCKTDETDSLSSSCCPTLVQKRSIFAPYWAKTRERPVENQDACTPGNTRTTVQILKEASQKSMIPPQPQDTMRNDRSCKGRGEKEQPCLRQRLLQDETSVAALSEQTPLLTPKRRAVSTSAISILKNKGDGGRQQEQEGGGRRRRSSSFSVSFDSKVNVVLVFQDKPPYQTRRIPPWWASGWLSAGMGMTDIEGTNKVVIEKLAVVS